MSIRVVFADDNYLLREGVKQLIETQPELELAAMAEGKNNAAIAAGLFLTERAVEKHINSIFSKLGLQEEKDAHRRVRAALLFLAEVHR